MKMYRTLAIGPVALCLASIADTTVLAQTAGSSYQGILGGAAPAGQHQSLNLSATLMGGYDQTGAAAATRPLFDQNIAAGGLSTMFLGAAEYAWRGRRVHFGATAVSSLRHGAELTSAETITSHTGGVGLSANFARRTTLLLNQTVAYSPSYLVGLFPTVGEVSPGDTVPPGTDYATDGNLASYASGTVATLSHGLTRRGTVAVTGTFNNTHFVTSAASREDVSSYSVDGRFSRNVSRNTAMTIQYQYQNGSVRYVAPAATTAHNVLVGIDYARPLSATRRAGFGFSFGTASVNSPTAAQTAQTGQLRMVGEAKFTYPLSRTWVARATYERGLDYGPQLTEPVFSDGVAATFEGLVTDRISLLGSTGFSTGNSSLSQQERSGFAAYRVDLQLRFALTSFSAIQLQYLYYYYDFESTMSLRPGMPPHLQRNAIHAGFTLWIPTLKR